MLIRLKGEGETSQRTFVREKEKGSQGLVPKLQKREGRQQSTKARFAKEQLFLGG